MREPSVRSVVDDRSDVELAAVFERVWKARGYDTQVRFSGPDVHVEVIGETPEGVPREMRVWVTATRSVTADMTASFARTCCRADVEPYLAVVGSAEIEADAHHPEIVELDAATVAVEVREAGLVEFVRDLAGDARDGSGAEGSDDPDGSRAGGDGNADRRSDRVGDADSGAAGDGGEGDSDGKEEEIGRREAIKTACGYVLGSGALYLLVERLSDRVSRSPRLRSATRSRVARRTTPLPDVRLPRVEWSAPTVDPFSGRRPPSEGTATATPDPTDRPANATAIPYADLRSDPAAYRGTGVAYRGSVSRTVERDAHREATVEIEDADGRPSGGVIVRWSAGRFFEDTVGSRLIEGDRIRFRGVVAGEVRGARGRRLPLIDVTELAA